MYLYIVLTDLCANTTVSMWLCSIAADYQSTMKHLTYRGHFNSTYWCRLPGVIFKTHDENECYVAF